jgi:ketosteroid isomerase-like protein
MTVDELLDQQAIRDVLIRYTRGIDRMDPELVRSCYHPDAYDDHAAFRGDRDGFVEWFQEALSFFERTMHFVGNQLVEVAGDTAHAESYCIAYHRRGASRSEPASDLIIGLRYCDRLERRDGEWRIAHRVCAMDWSRIDPVSDAWEFPSDTVRGRRDRDDPAYAGNPR